MGLEAGANPVLVAFRLGHVSTRMAEQHHVGWLDRADKEVTETLGARYAAARGVAGFESRRPLRRTAGQEE